MFQALWLFSHHFYPPRGWGLGNSTSLPLLSLIPGAVLRFADAEQRSWFDPALWQDVSPAGGQEPAGRIFSVDEERVPCQYDDVIFQPQTSFRVNLDSSQQVIHLRSISLMGQVTRSWGEPPQHLLTASPGRCSTRQRMIRGFGEFFSPLCHQGAASGPGTCLPPLCSGPPGTPASHPPPGCAPQADSCLPALAPCRSLIDWGDNYRNARSLLRFGPGRCQSLSLALGGAEDHSLCGSTQALPPEVGDAVDISQVIYYFCCCAAWDQPFQGRASGNPQGASARAPMELICGVWGMLRWVLE